jgi:PAS domain S-box-containing protein
VNSPGLRGEPIAGTTVVDAAASRQEIATLAYDKWLKKGCPPNSELDDWLEAEKELASLANGQATDMECAWERLRDSEALYHSLVENLPQSIFRKDRQGRFTFVNRHFASWTGKPAQEILGKTDTDFLPPNLAQKYRQDDEQVMATGRILDTVEESPASAGQVSHVRVVKTPLHDHRGQVVGIQGIFWDVSEKVRAEQALRDREQRLELALKAGCMGTWEWHIASGSVKWSANLERIHGFAPGSFGGSYADFLSQVHPDDRPQVQQAIARALEEKSGLHLEYRLHLPQGGMRWVEGRGQLFFDAAGNPERMLGVCLDITERKRAEEALRRTEEARQENYELLKTIMEGTTDAIFVKDRQGRYLMLNSPGARFIGKPVDELIGKDDTALFSPETARAIMAGDQQVMASGEIQTYEDVGTAAGVTRIYLSTKWPYRDAQGNIVGLIGVSRDITERKRAEEKFRGLLESAPDAQVIVDSQGKIVLVNAETEKLFGYRREELVGQPVEILVPEALRARHAGHCSRYFANPVPRPMSGRQELMAVRRDGSQFPVEIGLSPLETDEGLLVSSVVRDISERRQAERRLAAEHAVTRVLAESADLEEAAPKILQAVCQNLGWDVGALWIVDRYANLLRCQDLWHEAEVQVPRFEETTRQTTFVHGFGLPGSVWARGQPAWVVDLGNDTNFPRGPVAVQDGLRSGFGFPIRSGDDTLAVIEVFNRRMVEPDPALIAMLAAISGQVSQFIERRQAERSLHERAMEFRLARQIQQDFLPALAPEVAGYLLGGASHPAQETGGDYLDFISMPGDHVGIIVGDASGHGIGAALLMAQARAYLRAFALTHRSVRQIVSLANRRLVEDSSESHFVTLFFARLHPPTGRLVYCNAGHLPAYVFDAAGKIKAVLKSTGIPLGLDAKAVFSHGPTVSLRPDDLVFFLTDGVTEAFSPEDQPFGIDRALNLMKGLRQEHPREAVNVLLDKVRQFSGEQRQIDDRTVVVVKAIE